MPAFAAASAFAQTTSLSIDYYVVRDARTRKCKCTRSRLFLTTTVVDNGMFKTKNEGTVMKTIKICTEN